MTLKSILTDNIEMKLLSLLLAATLWFFVAFEAVDQIEIPLTISYANTPSGLYVKAIGESGCLVRVEGPRVLLFRQKLKGVPIRLDLSGAGEGDVVFSEMESSVRLIQGVKVIKVSPLKVRLHR